MRFDITSPKLTCLKVYIFNMILTALFLLQSFQRTWNLEIVSESHGHLDCLILETQFCEMVCSNQDESVQPLNMSYSH